MKRKSNKMKKRASVYTEEDDLHAKVPFITGFRRPSPSESLAAITEDPNYISLATQDDDDKNCRYLSPVPAGAFSPVPVPVSLDDWLAQYCEKGQTFREYMQSVCTRFDLNYTTYYT